MAIRILVIRRDNIGDLVCTTPLFSALRDGFPKAHLAALVNSYNAPVLNNNPFLDTVYVYQKAKHRLDGSSKFVVWIKTLQLIMYLRRQRWDYVIVATTSYSKSALKFAQGVRPRRIIAYAPASEKRVTDPVPLRFIGGLHESEAVLRLLEPLNIYNNPAPPLVIPDKNVPSRSIIDISGDESMLVGLHISSRKVNQRWPIKYFSMLAHEIYRNYSVRFLVFWSPGASSRLEVLCRDIPLTLFSTERLEELITGLSLCDRVICSDGGGMHLAAGLGKPIICLFGNSNATRWHPRGVPYELLQKKSQTVTDITVDEVMSAYFLLNDKLNI